MNSYTNRENNFLSNIPPVTKVVLVINIALFIIDYLSGNTIAKIFALYSINTSMFQPYQLVTHMFMHAGFSHILFNMFGLYMFGRVLESAIGSKRFFILYFVSGLGAAGLQLLINYLQGDASPMLGASGAIFGVITAFAVMFPNVEMMFIFIPIPIKAKYMVPIFAVLELFFGVSQFKFDNIAHFAHLGGAILGFILIMIWKKIRFFDNP